MDIILPADITIDILSRLPAQSIYQCKQVCKTWRGLINYDQLFARKHQSRVYEQNNVRANASGQVSLVFSIATGFNRYKQFYYGKYAPHARFMKCTRINLIPMDDSKVYRIVGSCNGLVCISPDVESYYMDQPIYICNPITKEYLLLQSLSDSTLGSFNSFVCGFSYIPSTNEYKVVKIHKCDGEVGSWVYVYTLGSGKGWRYIGEITYKLLPSRRSIYANGALHWVDYTLGKQGNIVAFDLAEEKFSLIPLTPTCFINNWPLDRRSDCQLRVLGGSLCIVHQYRYTLYDIWSLKKRNEGSEYSHWSRDFNTFDFGSDFSYTPTANIFAVTEDDELLFFYEDTFYSHDLKQTRDNKLDCLLGFEMDVKEALLHANSYVSLKSLGEEDTQILELTEVDNLDDLNLSNCTYAADSQLSINPC